MLADDYVLMELYHEVFGPLSTLFRKIRTVQSIHMFPRATWDLKYLKVWHR